MFGLGEFAFSELVLAHGRGHICGDWDIQADGGIARPQVRIRVLGAPQLDGHLSSDIQRYGMVQQVYGLFLLAA